MIVAINFCISLFLHIPRMLCQSYQHYTPYLYENPRWSAEQTIREREGKFLLHRVANSIDDYRFPGFLGGSGVRIRRVDVPCKNNAERPGFVSARLSCHEPPEFRLSSILLLPQGRTKPPQQRGPPMLNSCVVAWRTRTR